MPELPEVETTRRGIEPHVVGKTVSRVIVRQRRLRWPVPSAVTRLLPGQQIIAVERRAKYLLLRTATHCVIIHLGMSGSLRILPAAGETPGPHDHFEMVFADDSALRFRDPRRFGAILWSSQDPLRHPRLANAGLEPLSAEFDGDYLYRHARHKRRHVKALIMDSRKLAGVGNIYANEALFAAGIHPLRQAGRISRQRYQVLATAIKSTLAQAIECGGSSIRDFTGTDGQPGYFALQFKVYGRSGEPCPRCTAPIKNVYANQRNTFYCSKCQT